MTPDTTRDAPALIAGLVVVTLGGLLLLDRVGALHLGLAALAPVFLAAVGAILLATGLDSRRPPEGDRHP